MADYSSVTVGSYCNDWEEKENRLKRQSALIAGLALAVGITSAALAKEVSGKVVAVYYEPVTVNNKTMDKISATVQSCGTGQFETVTYTPGAVSDDNSLGYLFTHLANHARSTSTRNQYMNAVQGYATFVTTDQNVVQKTTFWGYNWECGRNLDGSAPAPGGGASASPGQAPASTGSPGSKPAASPFGKMKKIGF